MKKLIENFPNQIEEALNIGKSFKFKASEGSFKNVVVCGLGGSGIGASFVKDATVKELSIPFSIVKGYNLPGFVDKNTLLIISSYSGNTEETLSCFEQALKLGAYVVAVSSGGEVVEICKKHHLDCVIIPGGNPPRSSMAYSTIQLFFILNHFNLISNQFIADFENSVKLINEFAPEILKEATLLADNLFDKIPVLYSSDEIEAITIRWRQQFNENGKQLCWHHVVPEMNHNELVGWRQENQDLAVVFLRNESDYSKTQLRMNLNKAVYAKCTNSIFEVWSKGNSFIERAIYLINIGDWTSYNLSQLRGFDVDEVKVIDSLKASLK